MSNKFVFVLLVFLLLFITSCSGQPVGNETGETTDAYEFPVRPGMAEWALFITYTQMIEACQIPESILKTMSTTGLVETVLNYPLSVDIFFHDNAQTGFEVVAGQFNGIPELLIREDAATELLLKYCSLDISLVSEDWELADRARYTLGTVAFIEILLVQDSIINKMTDAEKIDLITEALNKSNEKSELSGIYGPVDQMYTARIMAIVLQQQNYVPFMQMLEESDALQRFIDYGSFVSTDLLDEIISMAQEFLTQT